MKLVAKFGASILLLLLLGVPVMACLQPQAEMTSEERECCKQMAGQCAGMDGSSSHSCCTKAAQPGSSALVRARTAFTLDLSFIAVLSSEQFSNPVLIQERPQILASHSPPESPPTDITVLRV